MNNLQKMRRSIRWRDYDYSQNGVYFVTICTQSRLLLFGGIIGIEIHLNAAGNMIEDSWLALPARFTDVALDEYVVMPNHFHTLIALTSTAGRATTKVDRTLGEIVGAWKSLTTNAYIKGVENENWPHFEHRLWQRNYYERVVRSEKELDAIREYIALNPTRWENNAENPHCPPSSSSTIQK